MAARSTGIVLRNRTAEDLTLTSTGLPGGERTQKPPEAVESALEHTTSFGPSPHGFPYVKAGAY
jgi:hypothetical protein